VARLQLDQWGSAEASLTNQNFHVELYPCRLLPYLIRTPSRDEQVALERCHQVLREYILEIKNWQEVLEQGPEPEDLNAPWFNELNTHQ
jgi:hypothetical protein